MYKTTFLILAGIIGFHYLAVFSTGCAQISAPTGGPRDSLPPLLVKANPALNATNFTGKNITLAFNEYIDVVELPGNLLISPLQKNNPVISVNLKSINIRFKDSLLPNTTYSINFGNAIKDVHEGNVLKNFNYVFSTGNHIDSFSITGKVVLAETGLADSTIMLLLHKNLSDTAVQKLKPDYLAKPEGNGNFRFDHLPGQGFRIYALKDGDGSKTYNAKSEIFAFSDVVVNPMQQTNTLLLYAYAEKKTDKLKTTALKAPAEKKLKFTSSLAEQPQDLLWPLELIFNNPLKTVEISKLVLTDSNFTPIPGISAVLDSTRKKLTLSPVWKPGTVYCLVVNKTAVLDTAGNALSRNDTIRFSTKKETDYGTVMLRFPNTLLPNSPVIQFVQGENIKFAYPVTNTEWSNKRFPPGEYILRILYDRNKNGVWDPGNFNQKIQPETTLHLEQKLSVRADWDNEIDIKL